MIQELLSGGNTVRINKQDQKDKLYNANQSSPPSSAAENLRCPRCDSSNTKFCYYNNYNLTQPRHFCKTCRRYWTKGGALRNVPIGGGCRKTKTTVPASAFGKSAGKIKTASSEFVNATLFRGFEHADHQALSANANILWAPSQNNHHLLSLLRGANQNPTYPNNHHLENSVTVKEEGSNNFLFRSTPVSGFTGLNPLGPTHVASTGPSRSLYRNQVPANQGFVRCEIQNNGLQDMYHYHRTRLLSPSPSCYYPENAPLILGGTIGSANSSTASAILESTPVGTGDPGLWNAYLSLPTDLSTTNGAYL